MKEKISLLLIGNTGISVVSTRNLLGLTANKKKISLFLLATQVVKQAWVWSLEQLRKIWLLAKEPARTQISFSPFLIMLEFNEYNENINKSMSLSYQLLSLFITIATKAN